MEGKEQVRQQDGNQDLDSLKSFINYEKAFTELLRELNLKPAQSQLIRAFLEASKGETEFETSYWDITKILYKTDGKYLSDVVVGLFH